MAPAEPVVGEAMLDGYSGVILAREAAGKRR